MAIHTLKYLQEISDTINGDNTSLERAKHGLDYAPLGNGVDFEDYQALHKCETFQEYKLICVKLLAKYTVIWQLLGKPNNMEAWNEACRDLDNKKGSQFGQIMTINVL